MERKKMYLKNDTEAYVDSTNICYTIYLNTGHHKPQYHLCMTHLYKVCIMADFIAEGFRCIMGVIMYHTYNCG